MRNTKFWIRKSFTTYCIQLSEEFINKATFAKNGYQNIVTKNLFLRLFIYNS